MASSMIPPRVSSSPPPLDTHPADSYLGLGDDEFDDIAPHNASFDITGLSDKLPPTPGGSPVKSPVLTDCSISFGTMSPPPSSSVLSRREVEEVVRISSTSTANGDIEGIVNGMPDVNQPVNDFDEYGDFENFHGLNPPLDRLDYSGSNIFVDEELVKEVSSETVGESEISRSCKQEENPMLDSALEKNSDITLEKCSDSTLENVSVCGSHSIRPYKEASCETTVPCSQVEDSQVVSDRMSKCPQHNSVISDTRRSSGVEEKEQDISCSDYSSATSSPLKDYDKEFKAEKIEKVGSKQTVRQSGLKCQQGGGAETKQVLKHVGVGALQEDESHGSVKERTESLNDKSVLCKDGVESQCDMLTENSCDDSEQECNIKEVDTIVRDIDKCCEFSDISIDLADSRQKQDMQNAADLKGQSPDESSLSGECQKVKDKGTSKQDSNIDRDRKPKMHVEFDTVDDEFGQFVESTSFSNGDNEFVESTVTVDDFGNFHQLTADISIDSDLNTFQKLHEENKEMCKGLSDFIESSHETDEFSQFTGCTSGVENCTQFDSHAVQNEKFADFGQFSSGFGEEDDFGDFDAAMDILKQKAVQEVVEEEDDEYQVFQFSSKPSLSDNDDEGDDDFGTFVSPEIKTVMSDGNGDGRTLSEGQQDEFGSFSAADTVSKDRTLRVKERKLSEKESTFIGDGCADSSYGGFGDFSSMESVNTSCQTEFGALSKLELLVRKWIAGQSLSQQQKEKVPSLKFAVENDALLWRKLADLESSQALHLSWGSLHVHKLFLSSINIDARNIVSKEAMMTLFGQKWSSSVPLFAQTLSFSPLTPAKPSETIGDASQVGPTSCIHKLLHSTSAVTSPPSDGGGGEEGCQNEPENAFPETEEKMEEMIPPAKFDWSSSGLTNPLEGPALERELLSEGSHLRKDGRKSAPATSSKPSPLVQQILSTTAPASQVLPLESLLPEVRQVVEGLPDLSFMHSRVLMFPVRGEQQ